MVLLRLTVKIPPPEVVQNRRRSTNSTAQGKPTSFLLVIRNPEQVTLGELTWMITEKWSKLRPDAGPLQIKKLLDDEHDTHDLDLDLTAADVFVDNGKAARDGLDQRATVRVVQAPSTRAPLRYGSVVQDWNAVSDHYARVNASRNRPPIPLFPGSGSSYRNSMSGRVLPSVTEVNPPTLTAPVPEVAESVYNDGDNDIAGRRRGEMSPVLGDDPGHPATSSPGPILIPSLASGVRLSLDAQSAALHAPDLPGPEKSTTRRRSGRVSLIDRLSITRDDLTPSSKAATRGAKRRRSSFKPSELDDSPPAKRQNTFKTTQARHEPSPTVITPVQATTPAHAIPPSQPTSEPPAQSNTESVRESKPEPTTEVHSKPTPERSPHPIPACDRQPSPELNHEPNKEDSPVNDQQSPVPSSMKQSPDEKETQNDGIAEQEAPPSAQPEAPERPSTPRERTSTKYPPPFISATELLPPGKEPASPTSPEETSSAHPVPGPAVTSEYPDELGADPMEVDSLPAVQARTVPSEQTSIHDSHVDNVEVEPEPPTKAPESDTTESSVEESDVPESNAEEPGAEELVVDGPDAAESNAQEPSVEGSDAEETKAAESAAQTESSESESNTSEMSASEPSPVKSTPPRSPAERSVSMQGAERVDLSPEANKSPRPGPGPVTASPPRTRRRQTAKRQGMSMVEMQHHTNRKTPSPPLSQHTRDLAATINGSSKAEPTKTIPAEAQCPTLLESPVNNSQSSSQSSSKSSREDAAFGRTRKLSLSPVIPRSLKIRDNSARDDEQKGDKSSIITKEAVQESPHDSSESSSSSGSDDESAAAKKSEATPSSEFDSDAESAFEDLSTPADLRANPQPSEASSDSSQSSSSEDEKKPNQKPVPKSPTKPHGKANTAPSSSSDSSDSDSDESFGGDIPFKPLKKKPEPEPVPEPATTTTNTTPNRPRTRGLGRARNAARLQAASSLQPQPASSPFADREKSAFTTFSQPARRQASVASATPGRRPRTNLKELMNTMRRK